MRYLNLAYGGGSPIYPPSPQARAAVDRWLDWTLSTLQPVDRPVFGQWCARQSKNATWSRSRRCRCRSHGLEAFPRRCSQARRFIEGDQFTIADIAIGALLALVRVEGVAKPKLPNLERWFAQISERPGFAKFIAPPMS